MKIEKYVLGMFNTNTYVLSIDNECIIIDPASKAERIFNILGDRKLLAVLLTHGHFDHIKAVDDLSKKYNCPVYIHESDESLARDKTQREVFGLPISPTVSVSVKHLKEGKMNIGPFEFEVIFTPGHSKGSVCYRFKEDIFTGDTLFKLSVGRTDLYTGNEKELKDSLRILKEIKENLNVYPGHDEVTTLDFEKENNIYFN